MLAEIKKEERLLGFFGRIGFFDITGRVDNTNAGVIDGIASKVDGESNDIVVSLLGASYVSPDGFSHLLKLRKKCQEFEGDLRLVCGEEGRVRRVVNLLGLDTVFAIYPTEEEAVKSFSPFEKGV